MPRVLVLDDRSTEISPSPQRLSALNKAGKAYQVLPIEHPTVGSQVEIGKRVYEVVAPAAEQDEAMLVLKLVRVVA
jgi:hypothetical protein